MGEKPQFSKRELQLIKWCVERMVPQLVHEYTADWQWFYCPQCHAVLEREYMMNCDCCGQKLSWHGTIKHSIRLRIRGCLQKNSSHHRTPELEDWLCRRGQGGQGRKEAGCSLRSSDETDRGKGLYGGAAPVSREGNLDIRYCILGEGVQSRGEKSGVISANAPATAPAGATVPCIKINVGSHQGTQILIRYLGLFFCIF